MSHKIFTDEFRKEAVQLALTSGLSRDQVAEDLGVGKSTLGKWITRHRHDDLMSGKRCPATRAMTLTGSATGFAQRRALA